MRWDRLATVGVPIAAGVMTAAVLLGPAEERPALGARVHGAIAAGARVCAFRLETLEHLGGVRRPEPMKGIEVRLRDAGGQPLCEWRGDTSDEGLAETSSRTRRPPVAGESLTLEVDDGVRSLARATLTIGPPGTVVAPPSWSAPGPPAVTVTLPRGHVVPELPEQVLVEVTTPLEERPVIEVQTTGAEHEDARARRTRCEAGRCRYAAAFAVVTRAPSVRLAIDVTAGAQTTHWEGDLPIVPGGMWLDRAALAQGRLKVRSATPRDRALVSQYDVTGRLWGGVIPMTTDDRGFSEGAIAAPHGVDDGVVAYRFASEIAEPPEATISWPGLRMETVEGVSLGLLADGMDGAIAAEEARMARSRLPAFGLILVAGLFEVLFLLWRHRRQGEALDEHLQDHLRDAPEGIRSRTPIAWVTFLSAVLLLAFFILAAVAFWA